MDLKNLGTLNSAGTLNQPRAAGPAQPQSTTAAAGIPEVGAQRGIDAYSQLLSAVAADQVHEKSAAMLTTGLRTASATLRSAFFAALSRLPADLAAKDWKFSLANGELVFSPGQDELASQELAGLRMAFASASVESAAKQVAAVIVSIVQMRRAGGETGSLAWVRFDVDEANFAERIDLRSYITASPPGNLYHPGANPAAYPGIHSQVPPMLGGMDLRDLVTRRPNFLRADGSVNAEAVEAVELPAEGPALSSTLHGQCSCSQVRFILNDEFEYAFYCHCSRCRARTGSAFAAVGGISVEKLAVVAGHEHLLLEGECSDGYGARCSRCFTFLFAAVRGRKYLHVALGVLADPPSRIPDHHIYVGSKAPWYQITDSLPQYEELP